MVDELRQLGARIETFPAEPHPGSNVVATFTGTGKKKILILAHIDTVFKDGTAAAKPFYVKDGRAYGPGVMDNKGGVVAGLQALKILRQLGFKDYGQLTFLIDTNEETGSVGTSALIERVAKQHDVALNLEPGRPADGLVVERKGSATALIEVKGLAAHAGVAPEAGRNAAMEVAHQVLQLSKTADAAKKTTVNFTVLTANGPTNVIDPNKGDIGTGPSVQPTTTSSTPAGTGVVFPLYIRNNDDVSRDYNLSASQTNSFPGTLPAGWTVTFVQSTTSCSATAVSFPLTVTAGQQASIDQPAQRDRGAAGLAAQPFPLARQQRDLARHHAELGAADAARRLAGRRRWLAQVEVDRS